jgi:hypothetical protein
MRYGVTAALAAGAILLSPGTTVLAAEGGVGVSLTTPFGEPRINVSLLVNSPRFHPIGVSATDAQTNLSRLFVNSFIGTHKDLSGIRCGKSPGSDRELLHRGDAARDRYQQPACTRQTG